MTKKKMLLVDDEEFILKSLTRVLEDDFDLVTALGGEAAIAMFKDNSHQFDVVLCDFMMPGITGADIHAYLSGNLPLLEKKLIFMTGGKYNQNVKDFFDRTKKPFLSKPFTYTELLNQIEKIEN